MTDSYSNTEINIDADTVDYLASEADAAADEYQQLIDANERSQSTLQQEEKRSVEIHVLKILVLGNVDNIF